MRLLQYEDVRLVLDLIDVVILTRQVIAHLLLLDDAEGCAISDVLERVAAGGELLPGADIVAEENILLIYFPRPIHKRALTRVAIAL